MELLSLSTTMLKVLTVVFIIYPIIYLLQVTNASPQSDLVPVNQTIHIPDITDLEFNPVNKSMYVSSRDFDASEDGRCCIYIIGSANKVLNNITVRNPNDLEFNPANNNMYALSNPGATVSVINGKTNKVIDTVLGLGNDPRDLRLKFNPADKSMYVYSTDPSSEKNILSVLDSTTNRVKENISIGFGGDYLGFNPANNNFYMPIPRSDSVLGIDGKSNRVIDNVTVGHSPFMPMFNPANNNIYVPNMGSSTVSVIDLSNKVIDNITIPSPLFLEFNPANNNMYVSSSRSDVISVLNSTNSSYKIYH
jgi:YVTN family beta-propeller protein